MEDPSFWRVKASVGLYIPVLKYVAVSQRIRQGSPTKTASTSSRDVRTNFI